uniref:Fe2OG dioxygenase domain-containing protein n=1 Tax=Hanusia phi TaxID=3032 RepID=A0A7S0HD04_9CRYP
MRAPREIPKLGAVQRWVRDCDLGATAANDPQALRVLDAILRAAGQDWFGLAASAAASARQEGQDGEPELVKGSGMVRRFPAWCPVPKQEGRSYEPDKFFDVDKSSLRIIGHEKADERRPPNKHDLHIWYAPPSVLRFEQDRPPTIRFDFPSVPGAFFLSSVLSPQECWQIISVAEAMGFSPDEPLDKAVDSRADGCVWLVDDEIQRKVLDRIEHLMPPVLGGGKFAGLNARWRLYRYTTGNVYRPHVDGAWPGSGIDEEGNYVYDKTGDRWSRLTFVIYLTEDFEGGCTTFFTPARIEGCLELRGVEPRQGSVLCFPHGDTAESLVHEGSEVFRGVKYIVRTDALYMLPESQQSGVEKLYKRHMKVNSSDRWTVNK